MPVVTYTGLRWGALLRGTPDDPPDFEPPGAPYWYYQWGQVRPPPLDVKPAEITV